MIFDDLSNSSFRSIERVNSISNKRAEFVLGDIRDSSLLTKTMRMFKPDLVAHFAGLKAVGESVEVPLLYYDVNVGGTLKLLEAMDSTGCENFVFSSSATVYGEPVELPFAENHPLDPKNLTVNQNYLLKEF